MIDTYMTALRQIELLTPEQECELWRRCKVEGDDEARAALIEQYQPLVFREAMKVAAGREDVMDCIQEGTVGLIEAVERFDPSHGTAFSIFAVHRIRGRMCDLLRIEGICPACAEIDEERVVFFRDADVSTEHAVEDKLFKDIVVEAVRHLPGKERAVMERVYLADDPIRSVAEEWETSRSYIHRLHRQGLRRLRDMLSLVKREWDE